jgi:hypothetical protein
VRDAFLRYDFAMFVDGLLCDVVSRSGRLLHASVI